MNLHVGTCLFHDGSEPECTCVLVTVAPLWFLSKMCLLLWRDETCQCVFWHSAAGGGSAVEWLNWGWGNYPSCYLVTNYSLHFMQLDQGGFNVCTQRMEHSWAFCLFNCKNTLCKEWLADQGAMLARRPVHPSSWVICLTHKILPFLYPDLQLQEGLCATRQSLPVCSELWAISAEWS